MKGEPLLRRPRCPCWELEAPKALTCLALKERVQALAETPNPGQEAGAQAGAGLGLGLGPGRAVGSSEGSRLVRGSPESP